MQAVAAALGVTCEYCHAPRGEAPKLTANGKPRLDVGREMIAMTASLNATVQAAAGKTVRERRRSRAPPVTGAWRFPGRSPRSCS